jgi:hypothetical protein
MRIYLINDCWWFKVFICRGSYYLVYFG